MRISESKADYLLKHSKLSIILIYNLGTILGWMIFYPLIPILLGYPGELLEINRKVGVSYTLQFVILSSFAVVIGTIFLFFALQDIGKWKKAIDENDLILIEKIRKKCISTPHTIFILQIVLIGISVPVLVGIVGFFNRAPIGQLLRIISVVFSLFSIAAVFSHTFSKRLFTRILIETYNGEGLQGKRYGIRSKIFLQIVPMFMLAILLISVFAYSRIIEEKGDLAYQYYKYRLNENVKIKNHFNNVSELFEHLKTIKLNDVQTGFFAVNKASGKIITSDGYIPGAYFTYFANNPTRGDRVFGDSYETQGVAASVKVNGENFYAGIRFVNASDKTVNSFLVALAILLVLSIFVLYYFSKSLTAEISLVADNLTEIAEGEHVDLDRKLAVVSNDELGDLVIAFNKIQEKEKKFIMEIEEQQAILMEQERLAALGQLIGGISHNLKTPIMSLAGAIEGLNDLINEYKSSVGDSQVTEEDHLEIAGEMQTWVNKMKPYCSYMSDIITTVKGQTLHPRKEQKDEFTLDELAKRIYLLMEHGLKVSGCKLQIEFETDKTTTVTGDISILVQVVNNLIVNAIDAYEGKGGTIEFYLTRKGNDIELIIKDNGKGIQNNVKQKLFKEMITTKGKKGTGLGLFMSYSNIKARFKGKMWFESEEGKGTAFHVKIPAV